MKRLTLIELSLKLPKESILTPIEFAYNKAWKMRKVLCRCLCGVEKVCDIDKIIEGRTISCGCLSNYHKHGLVHHDLYDVWSQMKLRCYYEKTKAFKYYGALGVTMCEEWKNSFLCFYNWAISNGYKKGLQIDRYPNKKGDYEPSNCRFVTPLLNVRNRRNTVRIEFNNQNLTVPEWSEIIGRHPQTIYSRLANGWPIEKVLSSKTFYNVNNILNFKPKNKLP